MLSQPFVEQTLGIKQDIYSVGACFYTLLSGTRPPRSVVRLLNDSLVPLDKLVTYLPSGAVSAIHKAISLREDDRFNSTDEFLAALPAPNETFPKEVYSPRSEETATRLVDVSLPFQRDYARPGEPVPTPSLVIPPESELKGDVRPQKRSPYGLPPLFPCCRSQGFFFCVPIRCKRPCRLPRLCLM